MRIMELTNAILRQDRYPRAAALSLSWRILNAYPRQLREEGIRIACGETPQLKVGGLGVEELQQIAKIGRFEALELLAIMTEDQAEGDQLLMRLSRHDLRGA